MMKKTRSLIRIFFITVAFALISFAGKSQTVEMDWVEVAGTKVIVHYNIIDDNSNHQYLISLFSSRDNFTAPLTRVTGDVGTEVKPGKDKKIVWDVTKELGLFKGNLVFEVRGRVFIPFVKLAGIDEGRMFKRGKSYPLTWTSGNLSGQVNIELFREQERIWGENNLPNIGKYDWFVPGDVKKGDNYRLKFTNAKDRNDFVFSLPFTIKPKIPFLVKAVGVAAVGAAIVIISGRHTPTPTPTPADNTLGNPPGNGLPTN